jgi:hypothetical protein
MKKFIALSIVLVVLVGVAFAQDAPAGVTVTGKFDAWLMPLQVITREVEDGTDTKDVTLVGAGLGRDNTSRGPRGRLFLEGKTDKLGLKLQLQFYPMSPSEMFGIDDFAEVWVKPADWVKIDVGKFVDDTLRGKVGDGSWMDGVTVLMKDGDSIFSRFKSPSMNPSPSPVGALVGFTFGDLYIGAMVPGLKLFKAEPNAGIYETFAVEGFTATEDDSPETADRIYQRIQAAVGYTIKDIGLVRAQFVGANPSAKIETDNRITIVAPKIEVAFALTAVSGLTLDLGAKIPLPFKNTRFWNAEDYKWDKTDDDTKYQAPFQISLGAVYGINAISIAARVDTKFAGNVNHDDWDDPYKLPFELNAHLWPSYKLSFATIGLDVGIEYIGETTHEDGKVVNKTADFDGLNGGIRIGFGAWIEKGMGNATIKGGLAYKVGTEVNSIKEDGVFSIPIVFEYSF